MLLKAAAWMKSKLWKLSLMRFVAILIFVLCDAFQKETEIEYIQ